MKKNLLAISLIVATIVSTSLPAQSNEADDFFNVIVTPESVANYLFVERSNELVRRSLRSAGVISNDSELSWTREILSPAIDDSKPLISDHDVARYLQELDSRLLKLRADLDAFTGNRRELIRSEYLGSSTYSGTWNDILKSPVHRQWAIRNLAFQPTAKFLLLYSKVINKTSPGRIKASPQDDRIETPMGFISLNDYTVLRGLLTSPEASKLLPKRFKINELSKELEVLWAGTKTAHASSSLGYSAGGIDSRLYQTVTSFNGFDFKENKGLYDAMSSDFELLGERLGAAFIRARKEHCDIEAKFLDADSLKSSGGKWERVKNRDGKSLTPSSGDMYRAAAAFISGCHTAKNVRTARTLLELESKASRGVIAHNRTNHCRLLFWARFGIGGPRDEILAQELEGQASYNESKPCTQTAIDPSDPWRTLTAAGSTSIKPHSRSQNPKQTAMHDLTPSFIPPASSDIKGAELVWLSSSNNPNDSSQQPVHVIIDRPGIKVVLVLTSYETVPWEIEATPKTNLRAVLVSAYDVAKVRANREMKATPFFLKNPKTPGSKQFEKGLRAINQQFGFTKVDAFRGDKDLKGRVLIDSPDPINELLTLEGPKPGMPFVNTAFVLTTKEGVKKRWTALGPEITEDAQAQYAWDSVWVKATQPPSTADIDETEYSINQTTSQIETRPKGGKKTPLPIPKEFNRISHITDIAYDEGRHMLAVVNLGGIGHICWYDLKAEKWIKQTTTSNLDITSLVFDANQDKYVGWTTNKSIINISPNGVLSDETYIAEELPGFMNILDSNDSSLPRMKLFQDGEVTNLIYIDQNHVDRIWQFNSKTKKGVLTYRQQK